MIITVTALNTDVLAPLDSRHLVQVQ